VTIEEPTLLAHPADEPLARKLAAERELALELNRLVPRGRAFIVDPASLELPAVSAPLPRPVGVCSRCGNDVIHTPGQGGTCACGASRIFS
jgi:hypothetical protein